MTDTNTPLRGPQLDRPSTDQILAIFTETGSLGKTAARVGMTKEGVRQRLIRAGRYAPHPCGCPAALRVPVAAEAEA